MFNNNGYQSGQPLNLNNNNFFSGNNNQNIFGGGNQPIGYQNPIMISPNANVQQWVIDTANRLLLQLLNTGRATKDQVAFIGREIYNNLQACINAVAQDTNNFTNLNDQVVTNTFGKIIQFFVNKKINEDAAMNNAFINSMNNANMLSNAAGNINSGFNFNQTQNIPITKKSKGSGTQPRKAKYPINNQIQQYANALSTNNQNTNNGKIIDINLSQQQVAKPIAVSFVFDNELNSPIKLKFKQLLEFNPEKKNTWPNELNNEIDKINKLNIDENIKTYLNHCTISEIYWKSKGIDWSFEYGLDLSTTVKNKYEKRATCPVTAISITQKKEYDKEGYTVTIDDKPFMDCETDVIDLITLSQNNITKSNMVYAHLEKNDIVTSEKKFIADCVDGKINKIMLTKPNEVAIDVIREKRNIALAINYELATGIDIPYNVLSECYPKFVKIIKKYDHIVSSGNITKNELKEYIDEVVDCLYDLPRKWSEKIDKFIVEFLNEISSRYIKNLSLGVANGPYFNSCINVCDILKGNKYNLMNNAEFVNRFSHLINNTLYSVFTGTILNPNVDTDLNIIIESENSKDLLYKYYGNYITCKDLIEWKENTDTYDNKIEHLKKCINNYSVITVSKSIMITDIVPNTKYAKEKDIWTMYPNDNHLDPFEFVALRSVDDNNLISNILTVSDNKTMLVNPIPYYKISYTFDDYIGKMLVDF